MSAADNETVIAYMLPIGVIDTAKKKPKSALHLAAGPKKILEDLIIENASRNLGLVVVPGVSLGVTGKEAVEKILTFLCLLEQKNTSKKITFYTDWYRGWNERLCSEISTQEEKS